MSENNLLHVGIIGLGNRWQQRYRPALLALAGQYRIAAVADQVHELARREARALRCEAAGGVVQMLQQPDLDAVFLADEGWYGLWPLKQALAAGKPIFCGIRPHTGQELETLLPQSRQHPVMVDLPLRLAPVMPYLQQLCRRRLGHPRIIHFLICDNQNPAGAQADTREIDLLPYLDLCAMLTATEPARVQAVGSRDGLLTGVLIEFADGPAVQLAYSLSPHRNAGCRIHLICEKGTADARLPGQLRWSMGKDKWSRRWPARKNSLQQLLLRFHQAALQKTAASPHLADACCIADWQRAILRSLESEASISLENKG